MQGKYSPTVSGWYSKNKNWFKPADAAFVYDEDGYDSYGYNSENIDRAGNEESDYYSDDALFEEVYFKWLGAPLPY